MIIVHHLNNSRSQRILWMLEELGFEYDIRFYKRDADMSSPAKMRRIHSLGKSPILEDQDENGRPITLVETGAICEYLVDKAGGRMGPTNPNERILYRQFLHYSEGSVMPILFAALVASKIPLLGKLAARKVRAMMDVHLNFIETELSSRPWFAGEEITAADVMMSFPLEAAKARAGLGKEHSSTMAWIDRIHSRPAYRKALEKGGPYAFAN